MTVKVTVTVLTEHVDKVFGRRHGASIGCSVSDFLVAEIHYMKPFHGIVASLIITSVVVISTLGRADSPKVTARSAHVETVQSWEYKVLKLAIGDPIAQENELNDLGVKGWELVETNMHSLSGGVLYFAILKRPVP